MSKLARFTQKIFGSTAGLNQIGQFGSLASGSPTAYSGSAINPTTVQSLSNYLSGWFAAIMGGNSPAIEDLNALHYLTTYQLAYLMQAGVAEWDSATTYYAGSLVNVGGLIYISLTDNNLNNVVTNSSYWLPKGQQTQTFVNNGSFTPPAGVTTLTAFATSKRKGVSQTAFHFLDPQGNAYVYGGTGQSGINGDGTLNPYSSPVMVVGGLQFQSIKATGGASCFGLTKTGVLYAWGQNVYSTLGVGDQVPRSTPTLVVGGISFAKVIPSLGSTVYGISTSGFVYAWGYNSGNLLGIGAVGPAVPTPTQVLSNGIKMPKVVVDVNGQNAMGLSPTGTAYAWGMNQYGELGLGDQVTRSSPVAVLGGITFNRITMGYSTNGFGTFSGGLDTSGNAYMWGFNDLGQLGVGDVNPRSSPVMVVGGLQFTTLIGSYCGSTYALTASGAAYAWGSNSKGALGVGDVYHRSSPVAVLGGLQFTRIIVSAQQGALATTVYGFTANGNLYAWGSNDRGQCGDGTVLQRSSPVLVLGGLQFVELATLSGYNATEASVYATTADGTIYSWGDNTYGQLGVGDTVARSTPTLVVGPYVAKTADVLTTTQIPVVPLTSYPINISQYQAAIGQNVVGSDVDSLTIQYEK